MGSDGENPYEEALTPWKPDDRPEWNEISVDWELLRTWGERFQGAHGAHSWFLLWLPLRKRRHLLSGDESRAIIRRFPGDPTSGNDPTGELAFLDDAKLAYEIGAILPLLRHLRRVEHKDIEREDKERNRFVVRLDGTPRLLSDFSEFPENVDRQIRVDGQILLEDGCPPLSFSGVRIDSCDVDFAAMKEHEAWPRTRYRDAFQREQEEKDNASPQGAVLFSSGPLAAACSRLQWAVFLPVEGDSEDFDHDHGAGHGKRIHSLTLHGQFFLDAGRRKIQGSEHLHEELEALGDSGIDEPSLCRRWNQRLAQDVVLPLVLPALKHYVSQHKLSDEECGALAETLMGSRWFKSFRQYVCQNAVWMRTLQSGESPGWRLIVGDCRSRLRPVPKPPDAAPQRPWKVFPRLVDCNVVPYDMEAPGLRRQSPQYRWHESEIVILLSRIHGLFTDAPAMTYLADFLDSCAADCLSAEAVQDKLLLVLRDGLRAGAPEARRKVAAKARRLVGFVAPERRLTLSSDLPESVLQDLWGIDVPVLLVPRGLEAYELGRALPDELALAEWLRALDRTLGSHDAEEAQEPILLVAQGLLSALPADDRWRFLQREGNRRLRVVGVTDARDGTRKPVSVADIQRVREAGTLFRFVEGLRGRQMGIAPELAATLPDADVWLVNKEVHDLLRERRSQSDDRLPSANDVRACLAAVALVSRGRLGDVGDRRRLLVKANDPGTDQDARRGLRLLLHGTLDCRTIDQARLRVSRHDQHSAWPKLWTGLHEGDGWRLIPEDLADAIPEGQWHAAGVHPIRPRALIDKLRETEGQGIAVPEEFSIEQRNEILSRIEDEDLWRRLPLHTTPDSVLVSADRQRVYLAPSRDTGPLCGEAILIERSGHPVVAQQQDRWLRPLDRTSAARNAASCCDVVT